MSLLYLVLMGAQGSGKGTQAAFIRDHYGIPHVSTGDLFRAMRSRQDELARKIQQIMAEGRLVSDDDTNAVLRDRLEQPDAANGVILDGYPRNPAQAEWLAGYLAERGARLNAVLFMQIDLYTAFKRAFGRITAADGEAYNIYFNADAITWAFEDHPEKAYPPRLVATLKASGEALTRRPDDASAHAVLKRIDTYVAETQPLLDHYRAARLLHTVEAQGSIEAVWTQVRAVIETVK
jgi:adenylate kinase